MSRSRKAQPYRQSRRFDKTCRCHGSCPHCRGNRLHGDRKRRGLAAAVVKAWESGE